MNQLNKDRKTGLVDTAGFRY